MASYTRKQQLTICNWLICSLSFSLSWLNGETEAKLQPLRYVFSRRRRVSHCADLQCVASFASESFRDVCICFYGSSIHTKYHCWCSLQHTRIHGEWHWVQLWGTVFARLLQWLVDDYWPWKSHNVLWLQLEAVFSWLLPWAHIFIHQCKRCSLFASVLEQILCLAALYGLHNFHHLRTSMWDPIHFWNQPGCTSKRGFWSIFFQGKLSSLTFVIK